MEQILDFLIMLDEKIFLFFNGMHSEFWDYFMMTYTGKFIWIPMYAMVLFILYRSYKWKTATIFLLALTLSIVFADQVCATLIRPYVERLRPSNLENPLSALTIIVDGYRGGAYGFPSCHAANSFALAGFLYHTIKRRGFILFILGWALINSYSRLYLGVHYPGDLIVGGLIGFTIGTLLYYVANSLSKRMIEYTPHTPRNINLSFNGYHAKMPDSGTLSLAGVIITTVIIITSAFVTFA